MAFSNFVKLVSSVLGSELVPVNNGGGLDVGATTGQIANAPGAAGSSAQGFNRSGNLVGGTIVNSAAVNPAGVGSDYIVGVITLSASAFDQATRSLSFQANGSFGATANNKRVKIQISNSLQAVGSVIAGATAIADTTTVATNGGGWEVGAEIVKYGAAGSNTQIALHALAQGAANTALLAPQNLTLNEALPIYLYVTANATTATTDIGFSFAQAFWQN